MATFKNEIKTALDRVIVSNSPHYEKSLSLARGKIIVDSVIMEPQEIAQAYGGSNLLKTIENKAKSALADPELVGNERELLTKTLENINKNGISTEERLKVINAEYNAYAEKHKTAVNDNTAKMPLSEREYNRIKDFTNAILRKDQIEASDIPNIIKYLPEKDTDRIFKAQANLDMQLQYVTEKLEQDPRYKAEAIFDNYKPDVIAKNEHRTPNENDKLEYAGIRIKIAVERAKVENFKILDNKNTPVLERAKAEDQTRVIEKIGKGVDGFLGQDKSERRAQDLFQITYEAKKETANQKYSGFFKKLVDLVNTIAAWLAPSIGKGVGIGRGVAGEAAKVIENVTTQLFAPGYQGFVREAQKQAPTVETSTPTLTPAQTPVTTAPAAQQPEPDKNNRRPSSP